MNILYVTHNSAVGGSELALKNIVSILSKKHNIYVLTDDKGNGLAEDLQSVGASIIYGPVCQTIKQKKGTLKGKLYRTLKLLKKIFYTKKLINKIIINNNIDIVHTNIGPAGFALSICQKNHIPHIWHIREYQDLDFNIEFFPSKRRFIKKIHSKGNYNISITKGLFDYYNLRSGIDKVIYDGVFYENESKIKINQERDNIILYVGRVSEAKGTFILIDAFSNIAHKCPEYKLLIVGSYKENDSYFQKCWNKIQNHNLTGRVEFLGYRKDVYDLMQRAKVFVVPSRFEGFGFITVEAMLNGCIVIGNNTAGTKEQFDNGLKETKKEIAFRYNTKEELEDLLLKALTENTQEMQQCAHDVVCNNYTIERNATEIEEFYNDVLNDYKKISDLYGSHN